jgi:hypothetical protein
MYDTGKAGTFALIFALGLAVAVPSHAEIWRPRPSDTFQWILQGAVTPRAAATVYDIDGFDNSAAVVAKLHAANKHVVCYIDVGTWENWRPDAGNFPKWVLGLPNGWPGERYLDIRQLSVLKPIMTARLKMCQTKGFDALEPDNMDSYQAKTGFPLTARDELTYVDWLIGKAHGLGLSIGEKNDPSQVGSLEPKMDWALLEECFYDQYCGAFRAYVADDKAVFDTEYLSDTGTTKFLHIDCPAAVKYHYSMELKKLSLYAWRMDCIGNVTP